MSTLSVRYVSKVAPMKKNESTLGKALKTAAMAPSCEYSAKALRGLLSIALPPGTQDEYTWPSTTQVSDIALMPLIHNRESGFRFWVLNSFKVLE